MLIIGASGPDPDPELIDIIAFKILGFCFDNVVLESVETKYLGKDL